MYQQINGSICCVEIDDKNKEELENELLFTIYEWYGINIPALV